MPGAATWRRSACQSTTSGGSPTLPVVTPGHGGVRSSSAHPKGFWRELFAPPEFYRERRVGAPSSFEAIFEPLVLLLTSTLFAQGLIQFGLALAPEWPVVGLLPLCVLVSLVAYLYSRRLARGVV